MLHALGNNGKTSGSGNMGGGLGGTFNGGVNGGVDGRETQRIMGNFPGFFWPGARQKAEERSYRRHLQ